MLTFKEKCDILDKDYERKVKQLHEHLTSIWTRFNFFITFQGIIIGTKILIPQLTASQKNSEIFYTKSVMLLGLLISVIWYFFCANDRYLVKLYRKQVNDSFENFKNFLKDNDFLWLEKVDHVAKTLTKNEKPKMNILGWRLKYIGLTDYATMFSIIVIIFWAFILVNTC